ENEYTLAGSIYKGRVTRVLPGMQSAFVNIGLERDAFLYVSDFLLEEDEDAEGLDQVVARPHIIASPAQGQDEAEQAEDRGASTSSGRAKPAQAGGPAAVLGERFEAPLEAADMMPPAEADADEESAGGPGAVSAPREDDGEQEREGAR